MIEMAVVRARAFPMHADLIKRPYQTKRGAINLAFADKTLNCRDCGQDFTFTSGEQEFYATHGFQNEPSRCPECRRTRRSANTGGSRQMYEAVCSSCGKTASVPFQPSGDKPVYCSECFAAQRASRDR